MFRKSCCPHCHKAATALSIDAKITIFLECANVYVSFLSFLVTKSLFLC